jgi:hypothetical protein
MKPKTKTFIANVAMAAGLLPYVIVFVYIALGSARGLNEVVFAAFLILLGLGIASVIALLVAFPTFLWSRSLAKSLGVDSFSSVFLRRAVVCGVLPSFVILPLLAYVMFRFGGFR